MLAMPSSRPKSSNHHDLNTAPIEADIIAPPSVREMFPPATLQKLARGVGATTDEERQRFSIQLRKAALAYWKIKNQPPVSEKDYRRSLDKMQRAAFVLRH